MRATMLIISLVTAVVVMIGGRALVGGLDPALGQSVTPPSEASVPGPLRPIVEPAAPPALPPAPVDKRRIPPPVAAPEPAPAQAPQPAAPPPEMLEGAFRPGAAGEKAAGKAIARPLVGELKLEKLAVTAGRDLELWLVAVDRLGNGEDLTDSKHVSLGKLKKAEGDQTYKLPREIDLRIYRTVVVWSRRERSARAGAVLVVQAAARPSKPKAARSR